jgi:hypothetical protein
MAPEPRGLAGMFAPGNLGDFLTDAGGVMRELSFGGTGPRYDWNAVADRKTRRRATERQETLARRLIAKNPRLTEEQKAMIMMDPAKYVENQQAQDTWSQQETTRTKNEQENIRLRNQLEVSQQEASRLSAAAQWAEQNRITAEQAQAEIRLRSELQAKQEEAQRAAAAAAVANTPEAQFTKQFMSGAQAQIPGITGDPTRNMAAQGPVRSPQTDYSTNPLSPAMQATAQQAGFRDANLAEATRLAAGVVGGPDKLQTAIGGVTDDRRQQDATMTWVPNDPLNPSAGGRFIPVKNADKAAKAPTEFQGKMGSFYARASNAKKVLDVYGKELRSFWNKGVQLTGNPLAQDILQTDDYKIARQAADDAINAIFRPDTGAAYGQEELTRYDRMYMPQPNDSDKLVAIKDQALSTAIEALGAISGPVTREQMDAILDNTFYDTLLKDREASAGKSDASSAEVPAMPQSARDAGITADEWAHGDAETWGAFK